MPAATLESKERKRSLNYIITTSFALSQASHPASETVQRHLTIVSRYIYRATSRKSIATAVITDPCMCKCSSTHACANVHGCGHITEASRVYSSAPLNGRKHCSKRALCNQRNQPHEISIRTRQNGPTPLICHWQNRHIHPCSRDITMPRFADISALIALLKQH